MNELTGPILQTTDPVTALLLLGVATSVLWVRQDLREDLHVIRGRVRRIGDWAVTTDGDVEKGDDGRQCHT